MLAFFPLLLSAFPAVATLEANLAVPNSTSVSLDASGRQTRQLLEAFDGCTAIPTRMCNLLRLRDPDIADVCCEPEPSAAAVFFRKFFYVLSIITGIITLGWVIYGLSGLEYRGLPLTSWLLCRLIDFGGSVHETFCNFRQFLYNKFCAGAPAYEDDHLATEIVHVSRIAQATANSGVAAADDDNNDASGGCGGSGPSQVLVTDLDAVPPATLSDSPILRQRKVAPTAPPALNEDQTGAEETPLLQPLPKTVQGESSVVEQGQSSKTD